MLLKRLDRGTLVAGGCMCLLGAFVIHEALGMRLGSPTRMGPGYYPLLIGIAALGLGLLILLLESRVNVPLDATLADRSRAAWRSRLLVPASMIVFALLLRPAGLAPAAVGLVCVASLAAPTLSARRTLGLAIVTPLLAWLIFVVGLGLPLTVIRGIV
ncbi:tripartite tricarboxylate transporter TctB family protein [Halomonas elongata]|uniref:tripartite tricarboxylate transporter TctB family protein n=1 Tax=Halomonas elongata TaxID=2746 RepID=UPI0038D51625